MSDYRTDGLAWANARPRGTTAPATVAEINAANWQSAGLQTFFGADEPQKRAYDELEHQVLAETGQDAQAFTGDWGGRGSPPLVYSDRARLIADNLGKLDKGAREAIAPLLDIGGRAAALTQADEDRNADVFARTYGVGNNALAWATYLSRQALDPANLAAAAIGLPLEGGLVKFAAREFLTGAAQTALLEPHIAAERAKLGLPNVPYLEAVAEGGLFNLGLAGAIRGGAYGVVGLLRGGAAIGRYYRGRGIEPPIDPAVQLAVADAVETHNVMTEQATPPTPAARAAMPQRIDRAQMALEGGRRVDDTPAAGGGADPTLTQARAIERQAEAGVEGGAPSAPPALGPHEIVLPEGGRLTVTPKVMELADLTVSHSLDGRVNPNYPQELQGRDRSSAASRSWVAEKAAQLEPALLGLAPTAQEGAPIVGSDGVVEAGNGRAMLLARAYDRHPERAEAYRAYLEAQGYSTEGFKYPVLVRVREGELGLAYRADLSRKFNIQSTAQFSPGERAFSDATLLDGDTLDLHRGGPATALANADFVRAFVNRVVAASERPGVVVDNVLSAAGARRIEAALVAKAYAAPDIVGGLFEDVAPTSRAILGALADSAGKAARIKAEISAGRIAPELDPSPALVDAFRLVERARRTDERVEDLIAQVDLEHGAVSPHVVDAVNRYFRDPPGSAAALEAGAAYRVAAGRQAIAPQLERTMDTALNQANAAGDMFGAKPDAGFALREGGTATMPPGDLAVGDELAGVTARTPEEIRAAIERGDAMIIKISPEERAAIEAAGGEPVLALEAAKPIVRKAEFATVKEFDVAWNALKEQQPFQTIDELMHKAAPHQSELIDVLHTSARGIEGAKVVDPGLKERATVDDKMVRKKYETVRQMMDVTRAGLVVKVPQDAEAVLGGLVAHGFRIVDEGWFREPNSGYFDRKVAVIFPDGMIGELQLHNAEMAAAKKAGGTAIYKQIRSTPKEDVAARQALEAQSRAHYDPVFAAFSEDWRAAAEGGGPPLSSSRAKKVAASAAESSRVPSSLRKRSESTSPPSTASQPEGLSTQASEPSTTAARPPQVNQRVGMEEVPSTPDIGAAQQKSKPPIGDPQLEAEAQAIVDQPGVGEDFQIKVGDPGEEVRSVSIAEARAEVAELDAAAEELLACIGVAAGATVAAGGAAAAGAAAAP